MLVHARLLIDLVTRAVGPQPGNGAFNLQELEPPLVELLLEPAQLTLDHGHFAIALLEHRIAAAEQFELLLLVGRAGVDLMGDFAQLHFHFADVVAR